MYLGLPDHLDPDFLLSLCISESVAPVSHPEGLEDDNPTGLNYRRLTLIFDLDKASWDDTLVNGLDLIANHVLQVPLFLMTLMRYITPTLDNMYVYYKYDSHRDLGLPF